MADDLQAFHRQIAAETFNQCWTYIDKSELSADDIEAMLALAFTSYWHWQQRDDATSRHLNISLWQLGRVHNLAGRFDDAARFGEKCVAVALKNELSPFLLGYGYEVLAAAALGNGDLEEATKHLATARNCLARVEGEEDAGFLAADLDQIAQALKS